VLRVGVASKTFTKEDISKVLEEVEKTGFNHLEVLLEGRHSLDNLSGNKDKIFGGPLELSFHEPIRNAKIDTLISDAEKICRFANSVDVSTVTFHPLPASKNKTATWKSLVTLFQSYSRIGEEYGVFVCVENMPRGGFTCQDPGEVRSLLETVASKNFGVALDVGHANTTNVGIPTFISTLKPWIIFVHLHDNHGEGDPHLQLGKGNITFSKVLPLLGEKTLIIEARNLREAEYSLEYLKNYLGVI